MAIFQKSVLNKFIKSQDSSKIDIAYQKFSEIFLQADRQAEIRSMKEEEYQDGFLDDLFVNVLGYVKRPNTGYNLVREKKNEADSKKADGAILKNDLPLAVIELKGTDTTDLDKVTKQGFGYKNNHKECVYVVTSNFEKLRFFIHHAVEFIEFNLFTLSKEDFRTLWLCLHADNLLDNIPAKIKSESLVKEEDITKNLYKDYSSFKQELWQNIVALNPDGDPLMFYKKTQKLIDRFLFIFFAEDAGLLPPNSISRMVERWMMLKDEDAYKPLYDIFKQYFGYINTGRQGKTPQDEIFAYNGGLMLEDHVLESISIDDDVLLKHVSKLTSYDFSSEVDVNILGHIFENSLNDIEAVTAELEGQEIDKSKTKRKKDGVFYTPKYITKYIVENTVGKLCQEKKTELNIIDEEYAKGRTNHKKEYLKKLDYNLQTYRSWLLNISICDITVGSGAFLNQALEFLMEEHQYIDDLESKLLGSGFKFPGVENHILENNIFGVDINEESIEIAKLSLWLRTAQRGRKLTSLNNNIKCGNSLIDDPNVAGDKSFKWKEEFSSVFNKGGFDVIIGNPPYVRKQGLMENYPEMCEFFENNFMSATANYDLYALFMEQSYKLINSTGIISFILPHKFLVTDFGVGIRNFFVQNKAVNSIVHFGSEIVFNDASTYTCIVSIDKREKDNLFFKKISPSDLFSDFNWDYIPYTNLSEQNWDLQDVNILRVIEKLKNQKLRVKDVFSKIFTGLQTSSDDIYLLEGEIRGNFFIGYSKAADEIISIEKDLVKPLLKGQDIVRYKKLSNRYFVIFPYLIENRKAMEMPEKYIRENFPKGYDYLKKFETSLRSREKGKMDHDKWFAYIYPKSLVEFEQVKILTPYLGIRPNFTLENGNLYHNTKGFGLLLNNPADDYLKYLAILNSSTFWFFLKNSSSEFRGGYMTFTKAYIDPFPLPERINEDSLSELASLMIQYNGDSEELNHKFLNLLSSEFPGVRITRKLEDYYKISWVEFEKELGNQKFHFNGLTKDDWMDRLYRFKNLALELKSKIDQIDEEINHLVYNLYQFTNEEIQIVENI